mmetsp:Transcript_19137/g.27800  ORF Transcript_19137/g.27800 Transcript_19137/m.27800 type:complete len:214 (-) Transcript_19137:5668-6309(-)
MEFVVVSKTTKNEDTVFVHLCVEYLNALQIANEEEYRQSICATLLEDEVFAQSKLEHSNFTKVSGKSIFQHPRTKRTACIKFLTNIMKIDEDTIVYYTCIYDITWQQTSHVADMLQKCKVCQPQKNVERVGIKYLACPISIIFDGLSADSRNIVRDCLTSHRCLFGINVVYNLDEGTATHRSLLVPMALFHANLHSPCLKTQSLSASVKLSLW